MLTTDAISKLSPANWAGRFEEQIRNQFIKGAVQATPNELVRAAAGVLRPGLAEGMLQTAERYRQQGAKSVYYLSMKFLLGQSLSNNLHNLGLYRTIEQAFNELGFRLADVLEATPDVDFGNRLARLAACFLDSLASLHVPGYGYGINYEQGLFKQEIQGGLKKDEPGFWAGSHSPWLIEHHDQAYSIPIFGRIKHSVGRERRHAPMWLGWQVIAGVPHDMPIVSQDAETVNYLRLFSAHASDEFNIEIFNARDYCRAVERKMQSETVGKVQYPSEAVASDKELRLVQEYFLVACAVRDIFRRFLAENSNLRELPAQTAIQLNDMHPALTVAELMRTLVDEHDVEWEEAWSITQATSRYTNHTFMPEALEEWPVELLERVLPRHLQIVYEINQRVWQRVAERYPGNTDKLERMLITEEGRQKMVRMASLSIIGCPAMNGAAALHSEQVRTNFVPDSHDFFPGWFSDGTNRVARHRGLRHPNPALTRWITERIGEGWRRDLNELRELEQFAGDARSQREFMAVKQENKRRLARVIAEQTGIQVNASSMFDIQVKRIHERNRQLLHVLGVIDEYFLIREDSWLPEASRVHIFAGKAAPGYYMAKLIIKLINNVASVINRDPLVAHRLKVVLLPDYKASFAKLIIAAADLSENIPAAGTVASGTRNMKFGINGALTIGTLDRANVEILEEVGEENIFIFGLKSDEVDAVRAGGYDPREWCARNLRTRRAVESILKDHFSEGEPGIFNPIYKALIEYGDHYLNIVDFASYVETQTHAASVFSNPGDWAKRAILNVARLGNLSGERSIQQYEEVWSACCVPPEV
jgi:starch phosphorylase